MVILCSNSHLFHFINCISENLAPLEGQNSTILEAGAPLNNAELNFFFLIMSHFFLCQFKSG